MTRTASSASASDFDQFFLYSEFKKLEAVLAESTVAPTA
jgi:hypothetical protein